MSLYAELDADNRVLRVVVCDSLEWLQERLGGTWVETGDTTADEQGAGPGLYDAGVDAPRRFIPPWTPGEHPVGAWRWRNGRPWRNVVDKNTDPPGIGWE